jgi:hypothetical protein
MANDEEATGEEQVANSPRERKLELAVTLLLGLSALLTGWTGYQASRFGGDQSTLYAVAGAYQLEAARADNRAGQQAMVDVGTFDSWVEATATGDNRRADFVRERFRDEFVPAFDAWLSSNPLTNDAAAPTPFDLPQYRLAKQVEADELDAKAAAAVAEGDRAGETSDKYVLTVVLFAAALFLLGVQSRIGIFELRAGLVGVSAVLVLGSLLWVLTLPKSYPF